MPARRRKPLARDLPAELQVAATNGSTVTDSRGRKYIDFVMGWCVGNFGWRPAALAKAVERFRGPDYVYPGYSYAPWTELARLLASLAPRPLPRPAIVRGERGQAVAGRVDVELAVRFDDGRGIVHAGLAGERVREGEQHCRSGESKSRHRLAGSNDSVRLKNGMTCSWKRTATSLVCVPG